MSRVVWRSAARSAASTAGELSPRVVKTHGMTIAIEQAARRSSE